MDTAVLQKTLKGIIFAMIGVAAIVALFIVIGFHSKKQIDPENSIKMLIIIVLGGIFVVNIIL